MHLSLSKEITISGTEDQVEKAKKALEPLVQVQQENRIGDVDSRLAIQDMIEMFNLTALVAHKGHRVWSRKRIINNLHEIKVKGPEHLSNYFYEFIIAECGSAVYFNKAAWIRVHPTVEAFGKFFLKNDYGKDSCEYIPEWKADSRRIVTNIQRILFPFQSYVRSKTKK